MISIIMLFTISSYLNYTLNVKAIKPEYYPDNATEIPAMYETYIPKVEPLFLYEAIYTPIYKNAVAYEYYTAITNKNSLAYKLQQEAYTDALGYRRINDYYLVATSKYFGAVGDKLKITYEDKEILIIIGDSKQTIHTQNKYLGLDGSMLEFIVDKYNWNHSNIDMFRGAVLKVEKITALTARVVE